MKTINNCWWCNVNTFTLRGCYWVFLRANGVRHLWVDLGLPGAESAPATIINGVAALGCGAQCRRLLAVRRTSIELSCNPVSTLFTPFYPQHTLLALFPRLARNCKRCQSTGSSMPTTSLLSLSRH